MTRRILDLMLALDEGDRLNTFARALREKSIACFVADDVSEYMVGRVDDVPFNEFTRALPPIAPPFVQWWTEWVHPNDRSMIIGALSTVTTDLAEFEREFGSIRAGRDTIIQSFGEGKWFLRITGVACTVDAQGMTGFGELGTFGGGLSAEGAVLDGVIIQQNEKNTPEMNEGFQYNAGYILSTIYQMLAFLACKNVEVIDRPAPRHERRRAEREKKPEPFTFKTLSIHPVARKSGGHAGPRSGRGVALHTVRGHFKTFDEHPLFGRVKGTFYWGSMARGSADRVVEKRYEVKSK